MLDHQRDHFIICQVFLPEPKFPIDRFAGAQQFTRRDSDLPDQLAKFLLTQWLEIIIYLAEVDAALTEQPVHFTTLRSSRFFVDSDSIRHLNSECGGLTPLFKTR